MSREFIWELEVGEAFEIFKCVVDDREVVTYENSEEKERLKITVPVKKAGVVQLNARIRIFGELIPLRLENDTPCLMLDGKWIVSDTTRQDRLEKAIRTRRRNMLLELCFGVVMLVICAVGHITKSPPARMILPFIIGIVLVYAGAAACLRLKRDLADFAELENERREEKRAKIAAWASGERETAEEGPSRIKPPSDEV